MNVNATTETNLIIFRLDSHAARTDTVFVVFIAVAATSATVVGVIVTGSFAIGLIGAAIAAVLLYWTLRKPQPSEISFDIDRNVLVLRNFRITRKFWSFGSIETELEIPFKEILRVRRAYSRTGHYAIRVWTSQGFFVIPDSYRENDDVWHAFSLAVNHNKPTA